MLHHDDAQASGPARDFSLGRLMITPAAVERLHPLDVRKCLARHAACDWGELDAEDWRTNDDALRNGARLLSVYRSGSTKFWIISEADRSVTTVLLPEDY